MTFAIISVWILKNKRLLMYVGLGFLILILVISVAKCSKPDVKIDEETIQKINSANEAVRKEELRKVFEENANVVQTIDNRTVIMDETVEQRNRAIDEKIAQVDIKIQQAKAHGDGNVTGDELECMLIPENCKK